MGEAERPAGSAVAINVGIIGAGVAAQSIHIPVLRRLADCFALARIWDIDRERCQAVAEQGNIPAAESLEALLEDPAIDAVVVCSPARFHAGHAIAAMRAGKRAVLVEKPVCETLAEMQEVAAVATETGAVVMAGSMHLHDPAWEKAVRIRNERGFEPRNIASTIVLPPNGRFMPWAYEPMDSSGGADTGRKWTPAELMRLAIMELAIHDLPLVRRLLPEGAEPRVTSAQLLQPFGYALNVEADGVLLDMFALMHGHWQTEWRLDAIGSDAQLSVDFTPSFVHAGSGRTAWREGGEAIFTEPADDNGYVHEWLQLSRILEGRDPPPDPGELVRDYRFICALAEHACALIAERETA